MSKTKEELLQYAAKMRQTYLTGRKNNPLISPF